ncbi:hypothetical protein SISSUDRAFT_1050769 [Sistotremastrum suecicum HHB10207 ss-3]|uniref:DUF6533 domain-containing protein n=1 Tax=Sistotremastrum suecicum HHB10207 ss-3 TaxID=1314776 RepID=A0A166AZ46_9AGAM|nr:hypothetical protein SISSUDRAFT_1050769 [Sistotremastrum suecicum HHB10207 ss-3]
MADIPPAFQAEWELLLSTMEQLRVDNYNCAAAVTWLAYDVLLTFSEEYKYIWRRSWSFLPKALYIFARYYGIFQLSFLLQVSTSTTTTPKVNFCHFWFWFYDISGFSVFSLIVNIIFVMRLHALFNRNSKLLIALVGLVLLPLAGELYSITNNTIGDQVIPRPIPNFPGCIPTNRATKRTLIAWIPNMLIGLTFFLLTSYRIFLMLQEQLPQGNLRSWNKRQMRPLLGPMLTQFMQDGALYFAIIFLTTLTCTIMTMIQKSEALTTVAYPWLTAVYSFAGSRLIINLRRVSITASTSRNVLVSTQKPETLELHFRPGVIPLHSNLNPEDRDAISTQSTQTLIFIDESASADNDHDGPTDAHSDFDPSLGSFIVAQDVTDES